MERPSEYTSEGFTARIHNEKNVTKEEILQSADGVWQVCRERKVDLTDNEAVDELMADLRRQYKDFCTSYPIVMRYQAQFFAYKRKTFEKYLNKIEKHPWKDEEGYLESQTDYVVMLYKDTHAKWNTTEVSNLRKNIRQLLQNESKVFKERLDASEEKINNIEKKINEESKTELENYFTKLLSTPCVQPAKDIVDFTED
jgi:ElaB/YqjD/DUF883 family membrane-anchored ribosome-binding protein